MAKHAALMQIRVTPELKAKTDAKAARQEMSIATYLRRLIEEDLADRAAGDKLRALRRGYEKLLNERPQRK